MPITFHPKVGQLLLCDFSKGFKEPEMVKSSRPVIVLSGFIPGRSNLATVVACSTVAPDTVRSYHYKLPEQSTPKCKHFMGRDTWIKGDMIYTVGYHRLDLILMSKDNCGKRVYFDQRLGKEQMSEIYRCVLNGIGMSFLCKHIE